jgi:3-oxoacyl-[acyl-carrier-protein] synthase II
VITGLGPITGLGAGMDALWRGLCEGRSAIGPIATFDPAGFTCRLAAEVRDLSVRDYVPKSYRKATKVMARDIELAVAAADLAARDAALRTKGTLNGEAENAGAELSYPGPRMGAHIGAGLIAAELNELTAALAEATTDGDPHHLDLHAWGRAGMTHLTPLWLLKYLPNMLACHVTIIHDAQGPSNTITCGEASGGLSIGESLRVIQRGQADLCFCGGTESKINPMALLRQQLTGRLNSTDNDQPARAVRPYCRTAAGTVLGEGGAIVILESLETARQRAGARIYAEVVGFGASQTVNPATRNREPDEQGRSIRGAILAAMREAEVGPERIDLIVPFGSGIPAYDRAEAAALRSVFGPRLAAMPLLTSKQAVGNCGAGAGSIDVCMAARALAEQHVPPIAACEQPLEGLNPAARPTGDLQYALCCSTGLGGQNAALVLRRLLP